MAGSDTVLFVSPTGNDRWSGRYPDPLPDGTDGPLASVGRARDAIRILRKNGKARQGIRIRLRGGTYRLTEPLTLHAVDSGSARHPVEFEACAGEKPVLSGGLRIEGWSEGTLHGQRCWMVSIPESATGEWPFSQLFVNGVRRPRTRLPREGFYRFAGIPEEEGTSLQWLNGPQSAFFANTDIQSWKNLADVKIMAFQYWFETHHRIKELDLIRKRVTFRAKSLGSLRDERTPDLFARYFIENVFEALENPGEWYVDRAEAKLFYLPMPGEESDTTEVVAPRLPMLVHFEGTPRKPVHHIRFENIVFQHADWDYGSDDPGSIQAAFKVPGALVFSHAQDCVLYGCEVAKIAQYGIDIRTGCSGNQIVDCTICDMGAGGVRIGHEWMKRADQTSVRPIKARSNNRPMAATVSDCRIHDGGLIHTSAIGIWIGNAGHNRILNNHICNLHYTGISCGWSWGYGPSATVDNRIVNNHIHHICWDRILSDNGGIYLLGVQPGTVVIGNHIHHIGCYQYGGAGIYPDEGSSEMLFENNMVHHTTEGGFSTHYGRDNVVRNNIFALSTRCHVNPGKIEPHRTSIFERNIVYWTNGTGLAPHNWLLGHFLFRDNLFWNGGSHLDMGNGTTLEEWQRIGQHSGTLHGDPLFTDPEAGDFSLRADSPAFWLGFRPIARSPAGPRFHKKRPVSFDDWPHGTEPRRPIVRTILELKRRRSIRVTVKNIGDAPAAGRLQLRGSSPDLVTFGGAVAFSFRNLRPGTAKSADFPIAISEQAEQIWVEAIPEGGGIPPALQFFKLRDPEWRIPRLGKMTSARDVCAALAKQEPRMIKTLDTVVAEFRAAVAGDDFALSVRMTDAAPKRGSLFWNGSVIEVFSHDRDLPGSKPGKSGEQDMWGPIRQCYVVPPAGGLPPVGAIQDGSDIPVVPEIRIDATPTADGCQMGALLPLSLMRIAPASRKIGLELVVFTTLRKGRDLARFPLIGGFTPHHTREGCMTVWVLDMP